MVKLAGAVALIAVLVLVANGHLRAQLLARLAGTANAQVAARDRPEPPRLIHVCWTNCFTLTLARGLYVRADGSDETWTIERFTPAAVILHRHDAPAAWNGFSADVTYAGRVSADRLTDVTINGKPESNLHAAWGVALGTLPGSNAERDQQSSATRAAPTGTAAAPPTAVARNDAPPPGLLHGALLETSADTATDEPRLMALAGRPSGATVMMNGHGGACSYSGKGYYSLKADGELSVQVMEDCGGVANRGSLVICALTATLACGPSALFPHRYQVTPEGLMIDSRRMAWLPTTAASNVELLHALREQLAADQNLARAAGGGADSGRRPDTADVKCSQPNASFLVGGSTRLLARMQPPAAVDRFGCIDNELKQYLAGAKPGDALSPESALGRCLQTAFPSTDWAVTRCEVVGP